MFTRKQFVWEVPIANAETGAQSTAQVASYWSPEKEGTVEAVAVTACAMAAVSSGRQRHIAVGEPVLQAA